MNIYEHIRLHYEQNLARLREAAETEIDLPLPPLTEVKFNLYAQTGNRLIYEKDYFTRRRSLVLYGLSSLIDHKHNHLQRLEDIIRCICEEETWALPAHVKRDTDRDWRRTVDLFASETAQALAEITTLLKDDLSEETQVIVRDNVTFRVLDPFFNKKPPYSWWEKGANNWNAVCCSCIGSAALHLEYALPVSDRITRILESLKYYIASFPEDGACLEGLAYFSYGMGYYVAFARQLKEAAQGSIDLFRNEQIARIASYQSHAYFSNNCAVPFSDSDPHEKFRPGLSCFLSTQYDEAFIPPFESAAFWDTDFNYRWATAFRDVAWTEEWLRTKDNSIMFSLRDSYKQYTYTASQQVLIHDERNGIFLGIKGGHNGEPHNHNDVGSFFLIANGEILLEDLGFGEYTKDYFAPATRYNQLNTRSSGHNIPLLDGEEQVPDKAATCSSFTTQSSRITMEIGKAYGENKTLKREIAYNKEKGQLTIRDASPQEITENLITRIKPTLTDKGITLKGEKSHCQITFFPASPQPHVISETYIDHYGTQQTAYRILHNSGTFATITIKTR